MTADLMTTLPAAGSVTRCPGCGSSHTAWVATAAQDNLLCKTCGTCWHPAAGRVERVNPQQCAGCGFQRICLAAQG